jgi:phage terminase large subunit GpA-like protein
VTATAASLIESAFADALEAEPELTISEWADAHRMLSQKAASEPGHWNTSRTPYLREIMDALSPNHRAQRVVFMKGSQLGGSECGNNWIGYVIHHSPAPMLMVQPTVEMARRTSKQRLSPMIESTRVLRERVAPSRSRDSGNTTFVKEFTGGMIILTGSNSGAGLRSMPIRFLFMDEVDEYPGDVDGQGDPVALAEKRCSNFPRRKILLVSTPTIRGLSRIEREYLLSDQRRYFLACPMCGHRDFITWSAHDWFGATSGAHHWIEWDEGNPETARMVCAGCSARVEEQHKTAMLTGGEWRITNPDGRYVGFHLSALYSPLGWKSWADCATEFVESKDDPMKLKTWINTVLGETWEERGASIEPGSLLARLERYEGEVPHGVGALVASVDVQANRLECAVKGFGAGEESWLIAFTQIFGDPGTAVPWLELDKFLLQTFTHVSGKALRIECVTIDAQHHSEEVYRFCAARLRRRVFAVRGGSVRGAEVAGRPTLNNRYRVPLFTLGTDTAKDIIYSRLAIQRPGPGYIHLPEWVDEEYVQQLTAEKAIRKWYKHKGTLRDWIKTRERNEALDLEVYALAALYIGGAMFIRSLGDRAERLSRPGTAPVAEPEPGTPTAAEPGNIAPRRPRGGWIDSWRR